MDPRIAMQLRREVLIGQLTLAAIRAALELELADRLGDRTRASEELAKEIPADPLNLYRLLRALTVPDLLEELPGKRFRLRPRGQCLRTDHPDSAAPLVRFGLRPFRGRAMEAIADGVRTGRVPMEIAHGLPFFEYFEAHPEEAAAFNAAMTGISAIAVRQLLEKYDFSRFRRIVDVGGGQGILVSSILRACPEVRGVLFDLPQVVRQAPKFVGSMGVSDRCEIVPGSFFDRVPAGGDLYVLHQIVHDWDDDRAARILTNVRGGIAKDGRLLVVDTLVPDSPEPAAEKLYDLNMLALLPGRERTREEMGALFARAGFRLTSVVGLPDWWALFEGEPDRSFDAVKDGAGPPRGAPAPGIRAPRASPGRTSRRRRPRTRAR